MAALLLLFLADAALACPTCKENLAHSPNAANLVRGYFWSIMFMMSMPFLLLGGLTTYFYLEVRKARVAASAAAHREPASSAPLDTATAT
jgi:heme/copper-type cytochrome/quinol oxidase subunit 2